MLSEEDKRDQEIARRRDEALRRALQTPPKPKTGKGEGKGGGRKGGGIRASRHRTFGALSAAQNPQSHWLSLVLRHDYPEVEQGIIWRIIHDELGPLESALKRMLERLPPEDE